MRRFPVPMIDRRRRLSRVFGVLLFISTSDDRIVFALVRRRVCAFLPMDGPTTASSCAHGNSLQFVVVISVDFNSLVIPSRARLITGAWALAFPIAATISQSRVHSAIPRVFGARAITRVVPLPSGLSPCLLHDGGIFERPTPTVN